MKNYTISEQKQAKYPVVAQNFNPRYLLEKYENQKILFFYSISMLDQFFYDTTHISVPWIYWSAKIVWAQKNRFEYIVPPHKWGQNNDMARTYSFEELIKTANGWKWNANPLISFLLRNFNQMNLETRQKSVQ